MAIEIKKIISKNADKEELFFNILERQDVLSVFSAEEIEKSAKNEKNFLINSGKNVIFILAIDRKYVKEQKKKDIKFVILEDEINGYDIKTAIFSKEKESVLFLKKDNKTFAIFLDASENNNNSNNNDKNYYILGGMEIIQEIDMWNTNGDVRLTSALSYRLRESFVVPPYHHIHIYYMVKPKRKKKKKSETEKEM